MYKLSGTCSFFYNRKQNKSKLSPTISTNKTYNNGTSLMRLIRGDAEEGVDVKLTLPGL